MALSVADHHWFLFGYRVIFARNGCSWIRRQAVPAGPAYAEEAVHRFECPRRDGEEGPVPRAGLSDAPTAQGAEMRRA